MLIDRLAFRLRPPKRWEIVAFRRTDGKKTVKRLIGLPNEKVHLDEGDVWIDDVRISKPFKIIESLLVPVHSDDFRSHTKSQLRWQTQDTSYWTATPDGFHSNSVEPLADNQRNPLLRSQFLTYHHSACLPLPIGRAEQPISDSYGFNQSLSRELNVASDIVLRCRIRWTDEFGDGRLAFRIERVGLSYDLEWSLQGCLTLCSSTGRADIRLPSVNDSAGDAVLTIGCVDGVVFFAKDGKMLLEHQVGEFEIGTHVGNGSVTPFAIGASAGMQVAVSELQVARDIHYYAKRGQMNQWQLGEGQYLLLGDNVPISEDAREEAEFGVIHRGQILGRVVPPNTFR